MAVWVVTIGCLEGPRGERPACPGTPSCPFKPLAQKAASEGRPGCLHARGTATAAHRPRKSQRRPAQPALPRVIRFARFAARLPATLPLPRTLAGLLQAHPARTGERQPPPRPPAGRGPCTGANPRQAAADRLLGARWQHRAPAAHPAAPPRRSRQLSPGQQAKKKSPQASAPRWAAPPPSLLPLARWTVSTLLRRMVTRTAGESWLRQLAVAARRPG